MRILEMMDDSDVAPATILRIAGTASLSLLGPAYLFPDSYVGND